MANRTLSTLYTVSVPAFPSDSPSGDLSDSDSEELAEMRIDDWLVFQLDNEVRERRRPPFP